MFTEDTKYAIQEAASSAVYDLTYSATTPDGRAAELAEAIMPVLEMMYPEACAEIRGLYDEKGWENVLNEVAKLCNY